MGDTSCRQTKRSIEKLVLNIKSVVEGFSLGRFQLSGEAKVILESVQGN